MEYKKIFLSCGELSGEMHSANLIREIQNINRRIKFYAVGGELLKKIKCDIVVDYKDISIMGFFEVLKKCFYLRKRLNFIKRFILKARPDLIILVDFPGFNLIIAKFAKKLGIKIVYYIPPQIWAWQYGRIKKIRKYCDLVIPILPFEKSIYKKESVPFHYYGHPLIDNIKVDLLKKVFYNKYNIPDNKKIIALMPGSREQEVNKHIHYLLQTAVTLENKYKDLFFVINCADTINKNLIKTYLKKYKVKNITVIQKSNYDLFNSAYAGICVSGTVVLEAAYFKLPLVVIYKIDALFYFIVKNFLIKIPFISLINIIAGRLVVKEIIQEKLTTNNLFREIDKIISDKKYRDKMVISLNKVKMLLGKKGVIKQIAREVNSILNDN